MCVTDSGNGGIPFYFIRSVVNWKVSVQKGSDSTLTDFRKTTNKHVWVLILNHTKAWLHFHGNQSRDTAPPPIYWAICIHRAERGLFELISERGGLDNREIKLNAYQPKKHDYNTITIYYTIIIIETKTFLKQAKHEELINVSVN